MDCEKELKTIQTWLKSTAGVDSFKRGVSLKLSRPVILFDSPGRSRAKNLTRYAFVQTVSLFGMFYVDSLDEYMLYQNALLQDIEDKCGVLAIVDDNGKTEGHLKKVDLKFKEGDSLDIGFTLTYEVAYKRAGWDTVNPTIEDIHVALKVVPEERK